jgi:transposase
LWHRHRQFVQLRLRECENGGKLLAREVQTSKGEFAAVTQAMLRDGIKIAIEAGNQTAWIYEFLTELGAEVTVVNPNKVKAIAASRRKTDKIDAKLLCELLRLNALPHPVHMPSQSSRELRGMLVARPQLIQARSKLCNVVRGMLRHTRRGDSGFRRCDDVVCARKTIAGRGIFYDRAAFASAASKRRCDRVDWRQR